MKHNYNFNNEYQAIVSSTEPIGNLRRKVWLQKTKNLFNKNTVLEGYQISGTTGAISTNSSRAVSDYIKVKENTAYTLSNISNTSICFFNSSKTFISSVATPSFTTPANTSYVRFGMVFESSSDYSTGQLELGSTATEYEDYVEDKTYILNDSDEYEEFIPQNGTILANIPSGTNAEITLRDNIQNYKFVEVYFDNGDDMQDCKRIFINNENNKRFLLFAIDMRSNAGISLLRSSCWNFNTNKLAPFTYANNVDYGQMRIQNATSNPVYQKENIMRVFLVIGYK